MEIFLIRECRFFKNLCFNGCHGACQVRTPNLRTGKSAVFAVRHFTYAAIQFSVRNMYGFFLILDRIVSAYGSTEYSVSNKGSGPRPTVFSTESESNQLMAGDVKSLFCLSLLIYFNLLRR